MSRRLERQPLAGLLVGAFASHCGGGTIITALSFIMGLFGPLVGAVWLRPAPKTVVLDQP
jgi:hypothetical protein